MIETNTRLNVAAAMRAVDGLAVLTDIYEREGWGIDAYQMALAHTCGKHGLDPSYAGKLDELYHRRISDR